MKFSEEESRTVKKFILEGRLNGLDLAPREFQHYNNTLSQIGQERAQFFGKVRVSIFIFGGISFASQINNHLSTINKSICT